LLSIVETMGCAEADCTAGAEMKTAGHRPPLVPRPPAKPVSRQQIA